MVHGTAVCIGLAGASVGLFAHAAAAPTYGMRLVRRHRALRPVSLAALLIATAAACLNGTTAGLLATAAAAGLGATSLLLTWRLVRAGDAANRAQIHRLQNKDHIEARLHRQAEVHGILDRYGHRFESILVAIEHHLLLGDPERAERIITLFARHLRNLLFEGSVPFLALKTSIEHIRVHLRLMGELTDHRVTVDTEELLASPSDRERYTESLQLTPWAEASTWPLFEQAERTTASLPAAKLIWTLSGRTLRGTCLVDGVPQGEPVEVRLLGDGHASGTWSSAVQDLARPRASVTARTTSAAVA
jgi:hypothetical protein